MKSMGNRSFRNRMIMLAIGAVVLVLMAAIYHFRHQKQFIRLENHSYLHAISELKINQLTQWYQERLSEAKFFSTNVPYNVYINEIIHGNRKFEPDFREALLHIMSGKRYENILLISTQGDVVYSTVAPEKHPVDNVTQSIINQVRLTRQITVSDFYYCPEHERVHIDFVSPAFDEHNTLIAYMVFRVEPDDYIMPLIRKWPMPTESAETYIVRQDGDSVAFLSQLRHVSMKPLKMKLSLDQKKVTAVRAVGGFEGIMEGVDYRGEKVLADIRKVPQTSWYMISEIDHREIYRELYKHATLLTIIIMISVMLIGFVTAWIYHYRQRNIYRELFEKQNLLNFREEELRATLYSIGEGVITADNNGYVVNLNPAAAIMTGWSEKEARNKYVSEVVRIIDEFTREPIENPVNKVLREGKVVELTNHAVLLSADGKEIPISDNAAPITDLEGKILGVVLVISNQTVQRARQKALAESEEKYRCIAENITDVVWTSDRELNTTYVSPSVERLMGESPEKHMMRSMAERFPPESLHIIERVIYEEMEKEKDPEANPNRTRMFEVEHFRADGSLIWVGMNVSFTRDANGNITGFHGVTHDITEQKRYEKQLKTSDLIFNHSIDMLAISDFNGYFKAVNPAWEKTLGWSEQELTSRPWKDFLHPDDEQQTIHTHQEIIEGKDVFQFENRYRCKNGIYKWLSWNSYHNRDENVIFSVTRDITERRMSEHLLRESEERYRLILDNSAEAIIMTKPDGTVLSANKAACKVFGMKTEEIYSAGPGLLRDVRNPEVPLFSDEGIGEEEGKVERTFMRKGGVEFQAELSASQFRDSKGDFRYSLIIRDISERKQTEEALNSSFALLKMAGESARFGGWRVDLATNRVIWSDVVAEIHGEKHGFSPTPEEGMQYYAPEWQPRIKEVYISCVKAGIPFDEEMEIITAGGERKWVRTIGEPIFDKSGNIIGLNGSFQDISKTKADEIKAEESRQALSRLISNISGIAYRCRYEPDWPMEFISQGCIKIAGYADQEFYANTITWGGIILEEDRDRVWSEITESLQKQVPFEIEYQIRHRNGRRKWVWEKGCGVYAKNGTLLAIEGFITDVTERRETEDALKDSMKNYRELIDGMNETVWVIDFDGTLIDVNRTATLNLGYTKDELLQIGLPGIDSSLTAEAIVGLAGSMPDDELQIFETSHRAKDGTVFPVEVYSSLVTYQGRKAILSIARDITLRKQMIQDIILAKEKAEESDRLKTAFLANVSHEIRTPMNGIMGFLELLRRPNLTEDKKEKFIDVVSKSGERLLETINKIIEVSKIESGQVDIFYEEVEVAEIMHYHYDFFKEQAVAKGVDLILNIDDSISSLKILSDRFKLDGIFTNLINNALKFTRMGYIEFGAIRKSRELLFYVRDTGMGIPVDKQEAIFERFVQADLSLTRPYEGSGLGLSIVKAYVELIGGTIRVESVPGEGSTFFIVVPIKEAGEIKNTEAFQDVSEIAIKKKIKILIAEDDNISVQYLKTILEGEQTELIFCSNGKDTVRAVQEHPDITVVLMDIKMPDMSGLEATREIRKINRTLPVIAQTAYALSNDKHEIMEAGCNDYITKPINRKELMEKIVKYSL